MCRTGARAASGDNLLPRERAQRPLSLAPDGFHRTRDLVRELPRGHLVVEGRGKDQINRGRSVGKIGKEALAADLSS